MGAAAQDLVCTTCGAAAGAEGVDAPGASRADLIAAARLTWTRGTERGQVVWTCDTCSRAHLRSIEAKLDRDWW
jgi:hypothetical protein